MLSNAAAQLHKRQKINGNGNDSDKESMQHHVLAIQSVNKRLRDPVEQTSDGVISAVIGFLCRDVRLAPSKMRPMLIFNLVDLGIYRLMEHAHDWP